MALAIGVITHCAANFSSPSVGIRNIFEYKSATSTMVGMPDFTVDICILKSSAFVFAMMVVGISPLGEGVIGITGFVMMVSVAAIPIALMVSMVAIAKLDSTGI